MIDGLHRVMSLKELNCNRIIIQIIKQTNFNVQSWDHMVPEGEWFSDLLRDDNFNIGKEQTRDDLIAVITDDNKNKYFIYPENDGKKSEKIRCWHKLVDYYNNKYQVDRIAPDNFKNLLLHKSLLISLSLGVMKK